MFPVDLNQSIDAAANLAAAFMHEHKGQSMRKLRPANIIKHELEWAGLNQTEPDCCVILKANIGSNSLLPSSHGELKRDNEENISATVLMWQLLID